MWNWTICAVCWNSSERERSLKPQSFFYGLAGEYRGHGLQARRSNLRQKVRQRVLSTRRLSGWAMTHSGRVPISYLSRPYRHHHLSGLRP